MKIRLPKNDSESTRWAIYALLAITIAGLVFALIGDK